MKLLALDSAAKAASAAVLTESAVLSELNLNVSLTHSQTLMPLCRQALELAEVSLTDLDGIAVSQGPGSFTGLRIGMAAVKGMAFAAGLPCVGVSTLEALAHNLLGFEGVACCVMDARRNQVYNALFQLAGSAVQRLCPDRALSVEALSRELEEISQPVFLVGDGAELCAGQMEQLPQVKLAPIPLRVEKAVSVGMAALPRLLAGDTQTAEELNPIYLRLPQAERERLEREQDRVK